MTDARERLRAARARSAEAADRVSTVKDTLEAAKAFASDLARRVEEHATIDHDIASDRAGAIKAALMRGEIPSFAPLPEVADMAAGRAEIKSKLMAARMVVDDLQDDLASAEASAATAKAEAAVAIDAVLLEHADELAREVLDFERRALIGRARLGGPLTVVGQLPGLSAAIVDVISSNERADHLFRYPRLMTEASRAATAWAQLRSALETEDGAELSFEQVVQFAPPGEARAA